MDRMQLIWGKVEWKELGNGLSEGKDGMLRDSRVSGLSKWTKAVLFVEIIKTGRGAFWGPDRNLGFSCGHDAFEIPAKRKILNCICQNESRKRVGAEL